jgi:LysM repeat protein
MASNREHPIRRCPGCGSRLAPEARECRVCGAEVPWRLTRAGRITESVAAVGVLVLVMVGLLWMRGRGMLPAGRAAAGIRQSVIVLPTAPATLTPRPVATDAPAQNGAPPPATEAPVGTYRVKGGDTLSGIAQQLGVRRDDILAANPDIRARPDSLQIGQELKVPASAGAVAQAGAPTAIPPAATGAASAVATGSAVDQATPEPVLYTVLSGDTLASVAAAHGLPEADLVMLNQGELAGTTAALVPGEALRVRPEAVSGKAAAAGSAQATEPPRPFPAPIILAPSDGQSVADQAPLLRWTSAGVLPDDVYYVVALRDVSEGAHGAAESTWVSNNATALAVPAHFRPAIGTTRTIEWSVSVRRSAGVPAPGDGGELLSPMPENRSFTWAP